MLCYLIITSFLQPYTFKAAYEDFKMGVLGFKNIEKQDCQIMKLDPGNISNFCGFYGNLRKTEISMNSHGFRDDEFTAKDGKFRILLLGDSYAFGEGVRKEDSLPDLLESMLRWKGYEVEVLNLGFPGNDASMDAQVFKNVGMDLEPDMVIIALTNNDDLNQTRLNEIVENKRAEHVTDDADAMQTEIDINIAALDEYEKERHENYDTIWSRNVDRPLSIIRHLSGPELPIIAISLTLSKEQLDSLNETCSRYDFHLIDSDLDRRYGDIKRFQLPYPEGHPNRLAYKEYATALSEYIISNNMLPVEG